MTQTILVAEDETIIAFDLCETVEEAGFHVQGPHAENSTALLDFENAKPDLAILDTDLSDGTVFTLARKLEDENIPLIFTSEPKRRKELKASFPNAQTLPKPCPPGDMLRALSDAIRQSEETSH